jgi:hypothetical protein
MPVYPDNSQNHPDQGMTPSDMRAILNVAAVRNEIIMFRNTGCWSRPYIARGHPTKPFHVKGKSADWGPQAGLVPENSEFSKAFKAEDIKKGIAANKHAIKGNYSRPVRLFLSEQFLREELMARKSSENRAAVSRVTTPRPEVMYIFCTKPNDDASLPGKSYIFLGKKGSDGLYEIFSFPLDAAQNSEKTLSLKESSAVPLMVMTVPGAEKPITGDYDLFAICPSWADYGSHDKKMNPALDDKQIQASNARTQQKAAAGDRVAIASLARLKAAETAEDPDRGNLTPRIATVIGRLAAAMGGKFPRVHHNAESGRPFAPGAEDGFPLTTFHPRRGIAAYTFLDATLNDLSDLRDYFTRLYAAGYFPPRNRSWNMRSVNVNLPARV